ncbi:hypothetical protein DVH24_018587 [Malus domestica]|uniref:Uncharacterized protein n=1 Tax=Malus domestica TaxID=3750 RepID=A0A498HMV6_MALDO|nr:hypothetical protein DVH24_018587 [Malus domestica]
MNVDYRDQPQQSSGPEAFVTVEKMLLHMIFTLTPNSEDGYITCFLPCITFGQIAETVDEGRSSCVNQSTVYGAIGSTRGYIERNYAKNLVCRRSLVLIAVFISGSTHVLFAKNMLSSNIEGSTPPKVGLGHQPLLHRCLLPCSNDLQRLAEDGSMVCVL